MPKLKIERYNCDHGYWGIPNSQTGPNWVPMDEMAKFELSKAVGDKIDQVRIERIKFKNRNKTDEGKHLVPGSVTIIYQVCPSESTQYPQAGRINVETSKDQNTSNKRSTAKNKFGCLLILGALIVVGGTIFNSCQDQNNPPNRLQSSTGMIP